MATKGLITLVFSVLISFFNVNNSMAWIGDRPACDFGTFNPVSQFNIDLPTHQITDSEQSIIFKNPDDNTIVVYRANTGTLLYVGTQDGNNAIYMVNPSGDDPSIAMAKYDATTYTNLSSAEDVGLGLYDSEIDCIYGSHNILSNPEHPYTGAELPPYPTSSPSPSPTPTPGLTEDEAKKFAQKMGIILAFVISGWIIYQFRFTRHE